MKCLYISILSCLVATTAYTSESVENKPKIAVVYSHGFGESKIYNDSSMYKKLYGMVGLLPKKQSIVTPAIDKKPGDLSDAGFYTQKSVRKLVNSLKKQVDQGAEEVHLIGRSNSGGVVPNTLDKLYSYDENKDYFKGTKVQSLEDAKAILNAVNKGSIVLQAPLLDMRTVKLFNVVSRTLSMATIGAATVAGCYFVGPVVGASKLGWAAAGYGAHLVGGTMLKNGYRSLLYHKVLPRLTKHNFDPKHTTPLEASARLKGKLNCPILIHFNRHDGAVNDFDDDSIRFAQNLANDKTRICVTDDGSHNKMTQSYADGLQYFALKYLAKPAISEDQLTNLEKATVLSVDLANLKKKPAALSRVINTLLWGWE